MSCSMTWIESLKKDWLVTNTKSVFHIKSYTRPSPTFFGSLLRYNHQPQLKFTLNFQNKAITVANHFWTICIIIHVLNDIYLHNLLAKSKKQILMKACIKKNSLVPVCLFPSCLLSDQQYQFAYYITIQYNTCACSKENIHNHEQNSRVKDLLS